MVQGSPINADCVTLTTLFTPRDSRCSRGRRDQNGHKLGVKANVAVTFHPYRKRSSSLVLRQSITNLGRPQAAMLSRSLILSLDWTAALISGHSRVILPLSMEARTRSSTILVAARSHIGCSTGTMNATKHRLHWQGLSDNSLWFTLCLRPQAVFEVLFRTRKTAIPGAAKKHPGSQGYMWRPLAHAHNAPGAQAGRSPSPNSLAISEKLEV